MLREASTITTQDLTATGTTPGTIAFMSPEQVHGEELDPRTDLFSFGVVIYEMATGRLPFERKTLGATFAAILHESPQPPTTWNSRLPAKLDGIVAKALQKDRPLRYQHASEIRDDLQQLRGVTKAIAISSADLKRIGTSPQTAISRNVKWKSALPFGLILLVLTGAIIFALLHRRTPWSSKLQKTDTVMLADFTNTTGDPVFDNTLKQALAVSVRQSPFLNILSDNRVAETLSMMTRPPNTQLTGEIARETCQRTHSKACIGGSISALGKEYVPGLRAESCDTGDVLAEEQLTADRKEEVLAQLGKSAAKLREQLGESLASVTKYDKPLEEATTSSLEALKQYSEGLRIQREPGDSGAIPYMKRATELDHEGKDVRVRENTSGLLFQLEVDERQLFGVRFNRDDFGGVDNVVGEGKDVRVRGKNLQTSDCAGKDVASKGNERARDGQARRLRRRRSIVLVDGMRSG